MYVHALRAVPPCLCVVASLLTVHLQAGTRRAPSPSGPSLGHTIAAPLGACSSTMSQADKVRVFPRLLHPLYYSPCLHYALPTLFYRLSAGFMNVRSWLADVREHADPHLTCILVGNKIDLCADDAPAPARKREVPAEEAALFAQEEGLLFVEASAKSGENVEQAFERATRDILDKVRRGVFDDDRVRVSSPVLLLCVLVYLPLLRRPVRASRVILRVTFPTVFSRDRRVRDVGEGLCGVRIGTDVWARWPSRLRRTQARTLRTLE